MPNTCPCCKHNLEDHCPETNTICSWQKCDVCDSVVDRRRRRGIRRGQAFTWPETQAT